MLLVLEGGCAYGATVGRGEGGLHVLVGGAARCGSGVRALYVGRIARAVGIAEFHKRIVNGHLQVFGRHRRGPKARSLPFAGTRQAACSRGRARRIKHRRDGLLTRLLGIEGVFRAHLVRRCSHGGPSLAMGQRVGNVLARRLGFRQRDHRRADLVFLAHGYSPSMAATSRSVRVSRSEQCSHIRQATL